jgi:LPS export ABC transporter protein LptC
MKLINNYALAHLIVTLSLQMTFCGGEKVTQGDDFQNSEEPPDQEMWDSQVVATKMGKVEAIVEYGHMARFSKRKKALFDGGIAVDFFDDSGKRASKLTAERGELDENTNDVRAMGHVAVVSDSGVTLYTEEIAYLQAEDKIISGVDVMITTKHGDTLYGVGFESDPSMESWRIKAPRGVAHKSLDLSTSQWEKSREDARSAEKSDADTLTAAQEGIE